MLDFAMAALALQIAAATPQNAPVATGVQTGVQLAQGRSNNHGGGQSGGQSGTRGPGSTDRQGVDCSNPLNAAHPNCSDNARSNSGGTQRGDTRSDSVQQLNLQNGLTGTTGTGRTHTHR